jgi:hypothetical protein
MARLLCAAVSQGLRPSEAVVTVMDRYGRRHFIREERELLTSRDGQSYLPVDIVAVDPRTGAMLVELPHEAENGAHRIWTEAANLLDPLEVAS